MRAPTRLIWPLAIAAVLAGILAMSAVWVVLALLSGRPLGGMALLAALDAVALLRLAGAPGGPLRGALALGATVASAAIGNWFAAAALVGTQLGLSPLASAQRLGLALAWPLAVQHNGLLDVVGLALGLAVAWRWGK